MADLRVPPPTLFPRRSPTHPLYNPAIAVELTMRERVALMTVDDYDEEIDIILFGGDHG